VLAKSVMEDTIDYFYETDRQRFSHVAECFVGIKNASNLSDVFLSLYSSTESLPEGIDFIKGSAELTESEAENDFFDTHYGRSLRVHLLNEAKYIASRFEAAVEECLADEVLADKYFPSFSYDLSFSQKLASLLESSTYAECFEHVSGFSQKKLSKTPPTPVTERLKETRSKLTDKIKAMRTKVFALSPENVSFAMKKTAEVTFCIYELLREFSRRFEEEKKQRNICSFNDVRRYALKLLLDENKKPTETAKAYADYFTDIYIDEYQDVDKVQDLIFRAIAKPDARFMVGDIKQSIYRFRGAEPDVFASYRKEFPSINSEEAKDSSSASIFMSDNFRCEENVIKFTNNVCSYIFSACAESMGYTHEDDLVYSKIQEDRVSESVPVELTVLVPPDDKENEPEDKALTEARYVAGQIKELIENGRLVNGKRITAKDIAVLFRASTSASVIAEALDEVGIKTTQADGSNYFENPDVLLMLCLLNTIDTPQRDVHLAGLLRSPLFDFSMEELVEIRRASDFSLSLYDALCAYKEKDCTLAKKCAQFDAILSDFRDKAVSLSVDKLIQYLYSTELFAVNGLVTSDEGNNLLRLYEYARKYENGTFKGLYDFIVYINKLIEEGKQFENDTISVSDGKVTLMNIHKSKGLEFPICFIFGMGKRFNKKDVQESLVFDTSLGLAMKIADSTGLARTNTPMRESLIKRVDLKNTEEEMRILYVAFTRARERLYVSATSLQSEEKLLGAARTAREFSCEHTILSTNSYLRWILSSLDENVKQDFCNVNFIKRDEIESALGNFGDKLNESTTPDKDKVAEIKKELSKKFSFSYPYAEATRLPAKISVSRLLPEAKNDESESEVTELFSAEATEYIAPAILRGEAESENITPAMRGTATHLFLQFCDLLRTEKDGVSAELSRLIEKGFIPPDSERLVFEDELSAFFKSELFKELKKAKKLVREQRFNILLPTSTLSTDEKFLRETAGEELAVQGVIDLLFETENGEIVLCDYKTDRLTKEERASDDALIEKMTERHAKQLRYYKEAVEMLFSRECKKVLIYSTHAGRAVEINV